MSYKYQTINYILDNSDDISERELKILFTKINKMINDKNIFEIQKQEKPKQEKNLLETASAPIAETTLAPPIAEKVAETASAPPISEKVSETAFVETPIAEKVSETASAPPIAEKVLSEIPIAKVLSEKPKEKSTLKVGQTVYFQHHNKDIYEGIVERINIKSVTVRTLDKKKWYVSANLLKNSIKDIIGNHIPYSIGNGIYIYDDHVGCD